MPEVVYEIVYRGKLDGITRKVDVLSGVTSAYAWQQGWLIANNNNWTFMVQRFEIEAE